MPRLTGTAALGLLLMISGSGALAAGAPVFEATPARESAREKPAPLLAPPPAVERSGAEALPDPLVSDGSDPAVVAPDPGFPAAGGGSRATQARAGDARYQEPSFASGAGPMSGGRDVEADAAGVLFSQLQDLQQEVMMLRGVVEGQQQTIERLEREQRERYLDLDRRLARGGAPGPGGGADGAPGSDLGEPGAGASDERSAYEAAFALTRERQFEDAIPAFRSLIDSYPAGQFTPNAWYWLGELYLALPEPELEQARQAFVQVESQWPGHQKTPDALYKLGIVHDQLGEKERAREYLERVRQQHEGSSAARLAGTYLEQL